MKLRRKIVLHQEDPPSSQGGAGFCTTFHNEQNTERVQKWQKKIFSKNVKGSDRKLASSSIPHENKKTRRAEKKKSKHVSFALLCTALLSVNSKLVK